MPTRTAHAIRAGGARPHSLCMLALGGMLIAATSTRAEPPAPPLQNRAVFGPHLAKPDLPRIEITLSRPGFEGVVLALTRSPVSQATDGFAIYVMNEAQTAGVYCHIWIAGNATKERLAENVGVEPETPITGEAYELMRRLAADVAALTREIVPEDLGYGVIRSVPETIYRQVDGIRAASGGCN
jgi:hypothetical protein